MNPILVRGIFVGGLTGLLFGFDTAVVAGTTAALTTTFHLNPAALGWAVSSILWGTLTGALIAGRPADRYGARLCLRAIALTYFLSACGVFFAPNLNIFIAFRFLSGMAVGASSVLVPTYLAEIAPASRRGAVVGIFQLNIVAGILAAYLSNCLVSTLNLGEQEWRWKFAVAIIPAIILGDMLFDIPDSPRWLAARGRLKEAADVLYKIGAENVEATLEIYLNQHQAERQPTRLSWRRHHRPVLLAVTLAVFNQLSGINAILYYLNDIFAAAGFGHESASGQAVIIGSTNLFFTVLALTLIDRLGRKLLLGIGSIGLVLSLSAIAYIEISTTHQNLLLWMLILFVGSFAFSQGVVIWVYVSEIFPTGIRARGTGIGASMHWFMDAAIATAFPIAMTYSRGLPFAIFAVAMAVQFFVVAFYFPETKKLSLEKVQGAIQCSQRPSR